MNYNIANEVVNKPTEAILYKKLCTRTAAQLPVIEETICAAALDTSFDSFVAGGAEK